jgi:hypothetical protein
MAKDKPQRQKPIDAAVAALMSGGADQTKKKRENREWDKRRSKMTYDLPPALIARIGEIAEELGQQGGKVKVSDVARLLLEAGLAQYDAGKLAPKLRPVGFRLFDD